MFRLGQEIKPEDSEPLELNSDQDVLDIISKQYDSQLDLDNKDPLYKRLYLAISDLIDYGQLAEGTKLPTLTKLADSLSLSKGTVAHAYNLLQNDGYLSLTQGRGSFVAYRQGEDTQHLSRKDRAMESIEDCLNKLTELNFSRKEIQIFLDLKMREFYEETDGLKIALVSNSIEEQTMIVTELSRLVQAEFYNFSYDNFLSDQIALSDFDRVICSEDIFYSLRMRADYKMESQILPLCLALDPQTIVDLSHLDEKETIGILSFSKGFAKRMQDDYELYAKSKSSVILELLESERLDDFLNCCKVVIFPFSSFEHINQKQRDSIDRFVEGGGKLLNYRLLAEKSSLLVIRMSLEDLANRGKE